MTIPELQSLWQKEKEHYKKSEVGIGVQRFVWEVFQCPDLFDLQKGLRSTKDHDRKGEFTLEESNKGGQADAVIFMDSEVWIPVEVEKLEKAQSGEWQMLKYQNAFDKKYGLLTDGFEWRFYYGEIEDKQHYKWTIEEMFEEPERFCTFWMEYVKPKNYYLSFFEKQVGQQKMEFFDQRLLVDEHRERFFQDVTDIIKKLKDKLVNAGYFQSFKDESERDKKATEIAYSYLIQFILYKTLVDNSFSDFHAEFEKKSSLIHQNLKKEAFNSVLMILEGMSSKISENIYKPFHSEQAAILEQVKDIVHSGEDNIISVAPFLDIFVFIKKYHFADVQNDIFGAIYENYLKELYEEQQLGQYFTDPAVVNFMLEQIGYSASSIKEKNHEGMSIVDPSCGSGTFLYSAVREIVKSRDYSNQEESKKIEHDVLQNVFGLDIAEFPLYLAEMSILMKMLPIIVTQKYNNPIDKKLKLFVSEDSVAEFVGEIGGKSSASDVAETQLRMDFGYTGFMRDKEDLFDMKQSLRTVQDGKKFLPRKRFDYVIGNPPYIGYNDCSSMGLRFFRLLKEKQSEVSLSNVYGWNLHSAPGNRKKYPPKPNLYSFFMALGFALLKQGGTFCYIIPQTLITESDYDVVRHQLSHEYTIEKCLTFAGHLFIGRGMKQKKNIATSSLIIVCRKEKPPKDHLVRCVHFPEMDMDVKTIFETLRTDEDSYAKDIPQSTLRENVDNWNFIKWDADSIALYESYKKHSESMSAYYHHVEAEKRFGDRFYFDVGFILKKELFRQGDHPGDGYSGIFDSKDFSHYGNFRPRTFYPNRESDIELPKNAQGHEALRHKYKIVWEKSRRNRFYWTDEPIIPSMSYGQIIATDHKEESLFLFALLNAPITWKIYSSMFELQNEKHGIYIVVTRMKDFLRPPLIDSPEKREKKARIIGFAEEILEMEKRTIGDTVELQTLLQRFDDVRVDSGNLLLTSGAKHLRTPIKAGMSDAVEHALETHFGPATLLQGDRSIGLPELLSLPAFDEDDQREKKNEMDRLIYDLYELKKDERTLVDPST